MIRKLKLTNWRNYDNVSIDFQAGTTFVVASNGVGKTSLVEAARWALFGVASTRSGSPVRVGADRATSTIELALPTGQTLRVERGLTIRAARQQPQPSIHLDGKRISLDAFDAALREAFGAEPEFLARLTMPATSRDEDSPTALGMEAHLGRYFGVDGLQNAREFLEQKLKTTEKEIRQIKAANASTAQQLADLETAVTAAGAAVEDTIEAYNEARATHEDLRARLQAEQFREAWTARHKDWIGQTNDLLAEIARELDESVDRVSAEDRLSAHTDDLGQVIEKMRIQIAIRESHAEIIRTNQASLDDSHDDCPVCRRPLDDETVMLAHRSNEAELAALTAEVAALRTEETAATTRHRRVQALAQRWRSVPDPGPEPEEPVEPTPRSTDIEEAAAQMSMALERLVDARTGKADTERRLREAHEADDAMRQLMNLFHNEANIRVALETTRATLDELLDQTVRPLATEVDQRWRALFPSRGELNTRADGSITRNVKGHPLPYETFSTGESMVATIVLRLLVAQMATSADFCWFDEPLEHLDPDVRRQVANILSRASDGNGQLRQVVVTTYEEPLARHLNTRNPEHVHLIDVRQAPDPDKHETHSSTTPS